MSENSSQTINKWLLRTTRKLEDAGITTARLDCLVLLENLLDKDRTQLLAHDDQKLTNEQISVLSPLIERRKNHEPLAYIRGKSEFYGREFIVNKHTLEPRPETETIITLLKELILKPQKPPLKEDDPLTERGNVNWVIVDVGTGSGCIGITVKLEVPKAEVIGIDVSDECIKVAEQNAIKLGADVTFYKGNLLGSIENYTLAVGSSILLCNLPYVPDAHTINQAAMQEPKLAIFGGSDGLDLYRKMFKQINGMEVKPTHILTESLPFQHPELASIAKQNGYSLSRTDDFIQSFSL